MYKIHYILSIIIIIIIKFHYVLIQQSDDQLQKMHKHVLREKSQLHKTYTSKT
jgi:hypothetical protein